MGPELSSIEEEDEVPTGLICADCEDPLCYGAEVALVQIVQPKLAGGAVFYYPVIDENDLDGDFLFEPYIYCFSCWDEQFWDLKREAEDVPPVQDVHGIVECACCGSSVREWEYAATFTVGELDPSAREPSNVPGPHFVPAGKTEVICLYCMIVLNDNYITMWEELSQFGECADCTLARCWRYETQRCGCSCHDHTEETPTP